MHQPFSLSLSKTAALFVMFSLAFIAQASAEPSLAPVEGVLNYAAELITGPIGRLIAIIAVAGAGLLTMAGQLQAKTLLFIFLGVGLIFGAAAIVSSIESATSGGG